MTPVRWCTISPPEQKKCNALAKAIEGDVLYFDKTYTELTCIQVR